MRTNFMADLPTLDVLPTLARVGDWCVLAERTEINSLDWLLETEELRSFVIPFSGDSPTETPRHPPYIRRTNQSPDVMVRRHYMT
jgi:hypothetical protein